jgi:hypothetical protein
MSTGPRFPWRSLLILAATLLFCSLLAAWCWTTEPESVRPTMGGIFDAD